MIPSFHDPCRAEAPRRRQAPWRPTSCATRRGRADRTSIVTRRTPRRASATDRVCGNVSARARGYLPASFPADRAPERTTLGLMKPQSIGLLMSLSIYSSGGFLTPSLTASFSYSALSLSDAGTPARETRRVFAAQPTSWVVRQTACDKKSRRDDKP